MCAIILNPVQQTMYLRMNQSGLEATPSSERRNNITNHIKPQKNTGASKRQSGRQTQDRLCVPNSM